MGRNEGAGRMLLNRALVRLAYLLIVAAGAERCAVCAQRFDSALRLDLYWHALVLDGVYTGFRPGESLTSG